MIADKRWVIKVLVHELKFDQCGGFNIFGSIVLHIGVTSKSPVSSMSLSLLCA